VVTGSLQGQGMEQAAYEWVHNYSGPRPFEPHETLDGVQFSSFTTAALQNPGDFPPVAFFIPGDHDGCVCDYACLWVPGVQESLAGTGETTGQATETEGGE